MTDIDLEMFIDFVFVYCGQTPDLAGYLTRTEPWTMRLDDGFNSRAVVIFLTACLFNLLYLSLYVVVSVKYGFRLSKYSFNIDTIHNFLSSIVFNFNTPLYMYIKSLTHVIFNLSRGYNLLDIPVLIKVSYTQLGIDILIIYYTVLYWPVIVYLLGLLILWFTWLDKIPEVISIDFTPKYLILENYWQLCSGVLVFDLGHVCFDIKAILKLCCSAFSLFHSVLLTLLTCNLDFCFCFSCLNAKMYIRSLYGFYVQVLTFILTCDSSFRSFRFFHCFFRPHCDFENFVVQVSTFQKNIFCNFSKILKLTFYCCAILYYSLVLTCDSSFRPFSCFAHLMFRPQWTFCCFFGNDTP